MGVIDLVTGTDIVNVRRHLGTGTTFPTTMNPGDTFLHTTLGMHVYNAVSWQQIGTLRITTAQRLALATTQLYDGFECYEIDTDRKYVWTSAAWSYVGGGTDPSAWITPAFLSGYTNYTLTTGGYQKARYRKTANGIVFIEGLVVGTGNIFQLPVGYRPGDMLIMNQQTDPNVAARMDILPDGLVSRVTGSAAWFSITCSFLASQ